MDVKQTKMFFRVIYILLLICFLVSLVFSFTKDFTSFSKYFAFALGLIFFLVSIRHKKILQAEALSTDVKFLYAVSFVASLSYILFLSFHLGRYIVGLG